MPLPRPAIVAALLFCTATTSAQAPSDWVGVWVPPGLDIELRIDLALGEDGTLVGDIDREGNNLGEPVERIRVEGRRLVLELQEGDELTLTLQRGGQRATLRGRYAGRRRSLRLDRRGTVWSAARQYVLDEMHADQSPTVRLLADAEDVEAGLRRAGRADALTDHRQGMCAFDRLVLEWEGRRLSATDRGALLGRVSGSRSLCEVDPSELGDPARCERLTILDSDGATTVRGSASSRSEGLGTLANGTDVTVVSRRGAWVRVEGPIPGWIHSSNAHCAPSR